MFTTATLRSSSPAAPQGGARGAAPGALGLHTGEDLETVCLQEPQQACRQGDVQYGWMCHGETTSVCLFVTGQTDVITGQTNDITGQTDVISITGQTDVITITRQTDVISITGQTDVISTTGQTDVISITGQTDVTSVCLVMNMASTLTRAASEELTVFLGPRLTESPV
ncbi:unnamed protein product [Arctogadus glacialis]